MKKIKLNLDYVAVGLKLVKPEEKDNETAEISRSYIEAAVMMKYKDGLDNQFRRLYSRIQRKLDEAIDGKTYEVEFEEGEMDFIVRAVEVANYPANLSKFIVVFEDELLSAKKEAAA